MKRIFIRLFSVVMIPVMAIGSAHAASPKARMEVANKVHDFGNIKEDGGPVTAEFVFSNTGDANLVIIDAKADCGCTKPEFPKKPVAPGKKSVITVKYNPIGRPGAFDKVVTVRTNGNPAKLRLKIRGQVIPKNNGK